MYPNIGKLGFAFLTLSLCVSTQAQANHGLESNPMEKPREEKPNVIVIISDDQGWADIGFNNPRVYSPHLNRLADESALLVNHYVMPQCTPTRVAAITGRYPGRFGPQALSANNAPAFPLGTPTLASMFRESGYATYLSGKWHLGSTPEHGPNHFGFDHSYGSYTGAIGMYDHRYRRGEFEFSWHRDHQPIPGDENGTHVTDLVTEDVIRIIEKPSDKPFFIYLAYHAIHTPLDERGTFIEQPTQLDPENPQRWVNENDIRWFNDPQGIIQNETDPEKRLLLAAIHHMDDGIGKIIQALQKTGKRDNTLIMFSSDNGPQINWRGNAYPNDLKLSEFNQPHPFRGRKTDVWEGGIHVPGFINWPKRIAPRPIHDPVHIIDWFPTLASLIEYQPTSEIDWDGTDLSPLLLDSTALQKRDLYWIWAQRTNRWALRFGDWKIVKYGREEPQDVSDWQLYNLAQDPAEKVDMADENVETVTLLHQRFLQQRSKDKTKRPH